jgi:chemotaxis protein histidine kinase CheA
MAQKVEIDIPGIGKILAENAASEHTLEELLKVMRSSQKRLDEIKKGLLGKTPPSGKAPGGASAGAPGASAANKAQQQNTQQAGKNSQSLYKLGVATGVTARGFTNVTTKAGEVAGSFLGLANSATNLINQFAGVGNSLSAAANSFSAIPVVGGLLANVFGAVAAAAEKQLGSFQELASVGATFGGSMTAMTNAASGAGLTVDQFAKIVSSNGQAMAELGGTTEAGAKRFADLGKQMKQSGLGDELLRLGYSTEGINKGMAGYLATMGSSGRLQGASTTQLAQGAATYMKELDGLSKITGQNREDLAKERERLAKDAQLEAAMQGMDEKQRSSMLTYIQSFPKAQQSAIKDMLATGTITSEEGVKMAAMYPKLASQMQAHGRTLQAGGQISKEAMNSTRNAGIEEARERNKTLKSVGQFNKEMGDTYSGGAELARQKINGLAQATQEQADVAKKASQAEALEKSKQRLAEFSNTMTNFLANSGLIDTMMSAFESLGKYVMAVAVPMFNTLSGVLKAIAPIITDYVVPGFQILGDFLVTGVFPIFERLGSIVGSILSPALESTGGVLGLFETSLYAVSDFIEDNLGTILATFLGVMVVLTAAKVVATIAAIAAGAADTAKALAAGFAVASDLAKAAASVPFIASMLAMAGTVLLTVASFLALNWPILAVIAAVGLLVYGAKKLGVDFKVLSDAASFVGSLMKTVFLQFQKGLFSLLNKIPGFRGDFDQAIKGLDEQLTAEGDKRNQIATDMGKRMEENQAKDKAASDKAAADKAKAERAELRKTNPEEAKKLDARDKRDAEIAKRNEQREKDAIERKKQAELKAVGDKTDAEKKAAEAKKETKEVDLSGPQAMLKSFSEQQNGFFANNINAAQQQQEKEKAVAAIRTEYQEAEKKYAEAKTDEEKKSSGELLTAAGKRLETAKKEKEQADKNASKLKSAPGTAGGGGGGRTANDPRRTDAGGGGGGGSGSAGAASSSSGGGGGGGGGSGSAGAASSSSGGGGGGGGGSAGGDLSGPKLPAVGDKQPSGPSPDSMQADVGDLSKYLKLQPGVNLQGLEPGVQKRLAGMASEYFNTTGQKIQVNTAYRDSKEQAELFKKYGSPRAAPPGRSKHEVGLAFDINSADANKAVGLGLFEKFGFARPISAEAWHIEAKEARGGSPDNPAAPGKTVKVAGAGGNAVNPDSGKPSAKNGGIVKGPTSGFDAELHGAEAVVPLPDGKKIPVTFSNLGKNVLDQLSQQSGFDPASYLNDIQNSVSAGGKSSVSMPDFKSVTSGAYGGGAEQESTGAAPSSVEQSSLGQEDSVSLLSSLNNKMDQLISINGQLANINSDQLRVQKGFSFGDMFKSPV